MSVDRVNPADLAPPIMDLYSHVAIGTGSRIIAIAGQVAIDANGELVGGQDHARQAEQAFLNLRTALAAVGADPADLLTYTVHVVDHRLDLVDPIYSAARRAFGGELPRTASTYLGVARLGLPEWLIEISGIAILP